MKNVQITDYVEMPYPGEKREVSEPFILNLGGPGGSISSIQTPRNQKRYSLMVKYRMSKALNFKLGELAQFFKRPIPPNLKINHLPYGMCQSNIKVSQKGRTSYIKVHADRSKCNKFGTRYKNLARVFAMTKGSTCGLIGFYETKTKMPTRLLINAQFGITSPLRASVNMDLNIRLKGFVRMNRVTQSFPVREHRLWLMNNKLITSVYFIFLENLSC